MPPNSPVPSAVIDLHPRARRPTCVNQFADWGAQVIKVEMPAAEATEDGFDRATAPTSRTCIATALTDAESGGPRGVEVLKRLVKSADILVEHYRPNVKHKLGIDYETLAKKTLP